MIRRILIANRGEIALRILRACREMGIEPICVYSDADQDASYLRFAEETICIGPAPSSKSYLEIPRIISAAEIADVDAIHPGYGFLAENAHFAEICESCGVRFIGPRSETIRLLGDKARAKEAAKAAGVPVVPGSDGEVADEKQALEEARRIGFPVLVKASAGGGGRGMRVARNEVSLVNAFHAARSEAEAAFGNAAVYLERLIERPRHIEIQVLADAHGHVVHLGERDCSIQRRHQKLLEESPSPALDGATRRAMGKAACRLLEKTGYVNAGTVEFLLDRDGRFYFMEVNARIQVEHPVTESVTGIDLVREQIRIAAGEELGYSQKDVRLSGHAFEFRINAENPDDDYRPSPGRITTLFHPGGPRVRVDSHVYAGYRISPHYDSLVAKLIVHGRDRAEALRSAQRALGEYVIGGITTTISLHRSIVRHPRFQAGQFDTSFLEREVT